MKKTTYLILFSLLAILLLAGCANQKTTTPQQENQEITSQSKEISTGLAQQNAVALDAKSIEGKNIQQAQMLFDGMTCPSCSAGVEYQLKELDGVIGANVDYKSGAGTIIFDADKISAEKIAEASDVYPATITSQEAYAP